MKIIPKQTHLHLELKVLVLPLPAENVTRNANFNGLLDAVADRPGRTGHQVLQKKSSGQKRKAKKTRKEEEREVENKRMTQKGKLHCGCLFKPATEQLCTKIIK